MGAVVREHDLPLAALLVLGTLAAAGLEVLSPRRRSQAEAARSGAIGAAGESLVAIELRQAGFPALHGVILGGRGWSTEIDHMVKTAGSIVAIETKTLSGRVEGRQQSRQWVQRTGGRERWFLNPLRQNATHLEAMRQAIGTIDVPLRGLVVVAGTAVIDETLRGCVVPVCELAHVLRQEMPGEVAAGSIRRGRSLSAGPSGAAIGGRMRLSSGVAGVARDSGIEKRAPCPADIEPPESSRPGSWSLAETRTCGRR